MRSTSFSNSSSALSEVDQLSIVEFFRRRKIKQETERENKRTREIIYFSFCDTNILW